jgi:hypothetical protein
MTSITALQEVIDSIAKLHATQPTMDPTATVLKLRKMLPALDRETASLAVQTFFSRQLAVEKLGDWAHSGFFSDELLQQASRHAIATYRARFFQGLSHVLEIGTGTGSDTAALARVARQVTSIEVDPVRADLARENLRIQGITNVSILVGTIAECMASLEARYFDGLFADPARRTREGVRVRDGNEYSPPLEFLLKLPIGRVRAIKVSPGLFFTPSTPDWRRHFIGVGAECLEQTLLFGTPITDSSIHLADINLGWQPPSTCPPLPPEPTTLTGYISEAHAVINRSTHLASFFAELGITQLAPDIAYGISQQRPEVTPLLESFRIIDTEPFSASVLKKKLDLLGWTNRTELKKRNCTLDLDAVRASLRLPPHTHLARFGTVFIFKWNGTHHMIIAERTGV